MALCKAENISCVSGRTLLHPYHLEVRVDAVIPYLHRGAVVAFWLEDFSAVLLGMDSDFGHLVVKFDYH
jgi:hypothetical protein